MVNTLQIRHHSDSNTFQVTRLKVGKTTPHSVQIPSSEAFPVEGRPNSNLSAKLLRSLYVCFKIQLVEIITTFHDNFFIWGILVQDLIYVPLNAHRLFKPLFIPYVYFDIADDLRDELEFLVVYFVMNEK